MGTEQAATNALCHVKMDIGLVGIWVANQPRPDPVIDAVAQLEVPEGDGEIASHGVGHVLIQGDGAAKQGRRLARKQTLAPDRPILCIFQLGDNRRRCAGSSARCCSGDRARAGYS